jgi:hypothetical protein
LKLAQRGGFGFGVAVFRTTAATALAQPQKAKAQ